jgi:glutamate synthase domain-containing protein 2
VVLQVVAGFEGARPKVDQALYRARLRLERLAREQALRASIASLSTRTVVYKGLVTPDALAQFYPDLTDARFASHFIVFHQRFSTNTSADWAMAQPFRLVAHNGEINTIGGNRSWMRARTADATSLPGFDRETPVSADGSDSRSLDDAVELLGANGYSLPHALARLMPAAWESDRELPPDVRAFFEFQSLLGEPWDGPSALIFGDGRVVGAALDRNGFRPARVVTTAAGLVAVSSEVGVLPADEHEIVDRGRLGPGGMIVVDLERGSVLRTDQIRRKLASQRPYRRMVADVVRGLAAGRSEDRPLQSAVVAPVVGAGLQSAVVAPVVVVGDGLQAVPSRPSLAQRQAAAGCTREEIDLLLRPMVADGHEAVGSMGDDAPPAVLSSRPRLFTDFFRQRFAQVTNPPVDPYREASVMSLTTALGAVGSYVNERAWRPPRLTLSSPVVTSAQLAAIERTTACAPASIDLTFRADQGPAALNRRLGEFVEETCAAVTSGSAIVVLTDRRVDAAHAAMPAVLATSAVHHALIERGLRLRASLVVDTDEARDSHQVALLCAFGASAVHPSLGYATVGEADEAAYRVALERGLLTIMSKMGVCTFSGYCGSQLFEILGLDTGLVARVFPGTPSPIGGATLDEVAAAALERHRRAFQLQASPAAEYPGLHSYRRDGEYHATNPLVVRSLQRAREDSSADVDGHAYATFKSHVYGRPPAAVRDLLEFAGAEALSIDEVESVDDICRRFFVSAMSVGALSPEAHRMVATAMNRIGARSNSGEGGEEPDRFGRPDGNRTKQVASARFGVTPAYLRSADELQIKIAQGSKPGEGGQLPALKVVPHIARLRHAQPGTPLISPPVHHDIYSIEDLAELIHDLRVFHPAARINVKLVASTGVGIIATGVVKAGAGAIQISGHDGGTGASPRASIKHAGMPWELGLAEAHRALLAAGLRDRVVLQTDGGLKTGTDIAVAASLGADEYGFGTAALVALGCVMARQCHANTCPVGIATQRPDLRAGFAGTADMLIGYLRLVAGEVRTILASLGLRSIAELVGRADLLRRRSGVKDTVVLDRLLSTSYGGIRLQEDLQRAASRRSGCSRTPRTVGTHRQHRPRLRRRHRRRDRRAPRRRRASRRIGPPRRHRQRGAKLRRLRRTRNAARARRRRQRRPRQRDARRRDRRRPGGARTRPLGPGPRRQCRALRRHRRQGVHRRRRRRALCGPQQRGNRGRRGCRRPRLRIYDRGRCRRARARGAEFRGGPDRRGGLRVGSAAHPECVHGPRG